MDRLLSVILRAAAKLGRERLAEPVASRVRRGASIYGQAAQALAAFELARDNPASLLDSPLKEALERTGQGNMLIARAERNLGRMAESRERLGAHCSGVAGARRLALQIDIAIGDAPRVANEIGPSGTTNPQPAEVSLWLSALRAANLDGGEKLSRLHDLARENTASGRAIAAPLVHHFSRTGRETDAASLIALHSAANDPKIEIQAARMALRRRHPSAAVSHIARLGASKSRRSLEIALALAQSRHGDALKLIEREIARHGPTLWLVYLAGHAALWREDRQSAEHWLRRAIEMDRRFGEAAADLAMCLDGGGQTGDALKLLEQDLIFRPLRVLPVEPGIDLPNRASAQRHRVALLRRLGRDDEALALIGQFAGDAANDLGAWIGKPVWRGEALDGKRVLAIASRGIGDELRHLGAFQQRLAACAAVSLTCDPRLAGLLRPAFEHITFLPVARSRLGRGLTPADEERRATLPPRLRGMIDEATAEAARRCGVIADAERLAEFAAAASTERLAAPMLAPPAAIAAGWREKLRGMSDGRLLLGLSWRGLVRSYQRDAHYLRLDELPALFADERIAVLNLQVGIEDAERAFLKAILGARYIEPPGLDLVNDFEAAGAACLACDAVLSAGTALAELSGAVGATTVLALPDPSSISAVRVLTNGNDRYWPSLAPVARAPGENRQHYATRLIAAARLALKLPA